MNFPVYPRTKPSGAEWLGEQTKRFQSAAAE
jgi:hypothetical protein